MRISDWSSDVCSSDLSSLAGMAAGCGSWPEGSGRRDARPSLSTSRHDADGIGEAVSAPLAVLDRGIGVGIGGVYRRREGIEHEPEIGRASCRERVGQYV